VSNKTIDVSHVAQAWVHSHEEDTATTTVYRPAKFPFPPSRGRKGFNLQPGGILTARKPGPTDQTVIATGTWKLIGEQLELSPQGEGTQILCIKSVEPDRLVVQKTSTSPSNAPS
jgi:hypothetical protein